MKKGGVYRYSLQFDDKTLVNRQVGEFLERMGNRKSKVIVAAVLDFMRAHPEFLSIKTKVDIHLTALAPDTDLRTLVEDLISEKLANVSFQVSAPAQAQVQTGEMPDDEDVSSMLDNLGIFGL
ncbi:MAG: hypothetical protein MJ077_04210 [Oscillospiraceae bacterium]|nr:hypothetical protein [Oscillospiraceae bacterium]